MDDELVGEQTGNLKRIVVFFKDSLGQPPLWFETRGKVGRKPVKDDRNNQVAWKVYADDITVTVPSENVLYIKMDLNVQLPTAD